MRALTEYRNTDNASQFRRLLMRLGAAFAFVIYVLVAMLQPVQAQSSFSLSPEFSINYETGQIDINNGLIDVFNAELTYEDEVLFIADEIRAEFDDKSEPDNPLMKNLAISGLSTQEDDLDIFIAELTIINMPLNFDNGLSAQPDAEEIIAYFKQHTDIHYRLADIVIEAKHEGTLTTVDNIAIDIESTNRQATDAAGSIISYAVSNVTVSPASSGEDARNFRDGLAEIGLDSIRFHLEGVVESLYKDRRLAMRIYQDFDLPQLFDLSWNLDLSFGHSIFDLNSYLAANTSLFDVDDVDDFDDFEDVNGELGGLLLANAGEMLLHRVTVNLEDKGFLAKAPEPNLLVANMEDRFSELPEPVSDLLKQPIKDFLYNGGRLAADANPPAPANLLQLGTIMLSPEVGIKMLGLTVHHHSKS